MSLPKEPNSREERYLSKMAGEDTKLPDEPITRKEFYLAKAAGQDVDTPNPTTRIEMYLDVIAQGGGGGSAVLVDKTITANGGYDPADDNADGYSGVTVHVPNTYAAGDEGKVVSNGALVSQTSDSYSANGTYDTTTKNSVTVAVPNTYAAGDEGKVVSNGALVAQTSETYTNNGTYDTTTINSVTVNVSGGGGGGAGGIIKLTNMCEKTLTAGSYGAMVDSNNKIVRYQNTSIQYPLTDNVPFPCYLNSNTNQYRLLGVLFAAISSGTIGKRFAYTSNDLTVNELKYEHYGANNGGLRAYIYIYSNSDSIEGNLTITLANE